MVRIRLSEVNDAVRAFLAPAQRGETIVVEDDNGMLQCGVTPYVQASTGEKQAALAALPENGLKTEPIPASLEDVFIALMQGAKDNFAHEKTGAQA